MSLSRTGCAFALALAFAGTTALSSASLAADAEIELPKQLVWTAYDLGSTGYSQAVGVGAVLKNELGINLRVLPGKNDVSRLAPLRDGKAQYSATGSESTYAQEAVYLFGSKEWGPQPLSMLIMAVSHGTSAVATAKDANIRTLADLKGKRVTWVKGAASLQNSMRGQLAFAGLTWDDVIKVEVPGYAASIQAVIDGQADAAYGTTHSAPFLKIEASPRGLYFPPVPHDDEEGWKRLKEVLPWFFPAIATEGPTLPPDGQEMASSGYPILATTPETSEDMNYNMTKAMVVYFDKYKDSAPGADGWALDRQKFDQGLLPYNPGAIRYFKELGVWTAEAQSNHDNNLKRQALLNEAWEKYVANAPDDAEAFQKGWMKARFQALQDAGMVTIMDGWDVVS